MPVAYRKPPRALVVPQAVRGEQPSDNDFTVLLQREPARVTVVPPAPPQPRMAAPSSRIDRRTAPPPPAARFTEPAHFADPEGSAPGTAVSVAPPLPKTARAARPQWQTLAMGAGIFLAFGCVSGIAVELVLSERSHPAAAAQAEVITPVPVHPALVAATPTANAPAPTPAPAPASDLTRIPDPTAARSTPLALTAVASANDDLPARVVHHHRRHHHPHPAAPPPAPVAKVTPPPAPAPAPVADPAIPAASEPDVADGPLAAPPAPSGTAPADDMAAAMQTLTQAKAELSL